MTQTCFCLFLGSVLAIASTSGEERTQLIPEERRVAAPGFNLRATDGKQLRLQDLRGKVILLNFWATWCGGCKIELPWLIEFDRNYRGRGLFTIGVSMDDDGERVVKPFLQCKGILYPVVIGTDSLVESYHLGPMPMTLLIDKRGNVAVNHAGVIDRSAFDADIKELLGEER